MYADRFAPPAGIKPGSLAIAIGLNAAVLAALIFSSPELRRMLPDPPLIGHNIPLDPPPPPAVPEANPQPDQKTRATPRRVDTPPVIVPTTPVTDFTTRTDPPPIPGSMDSPVEASQPTPPVALPILIGAVVDPRFAHDFQPVYPAEERRAERSGRVIVRVLIGIDGRVKQIEPVSATSDAFWRATAARARAKWRFRPATRGGVPEEAWRTMSVSFVLEG